MCGIHVSISHDPLKPKDELLKLLLNRGPDYVGHEEVQIETSKRSRYYVSLTSTVLSMRGDQINQQPFSDVTNGSILCWNGEAWMVGSESVKGNDGKAIFELLTGASSAGCNAQATSNILAVLRSISGPFAFAFLDGAHNQLYFGRDCLGRRSLLHREHGGDNILFELCSISNPHDGPWQEVEADGIYQISITEGLDTLSHSVFDTSKPQVCLRKHTWESPDLHLSSQFLGTFNSVIPAELQVLNLQAKSVEYLQHLIHESLNRRITSIPAITESAKESCVRVAVLFSGGLDCTILARIAHQILPLNQDVDLLNVAFENPRVVRAAKNKIIPDDSLDLKSSSSPSKSDERSAEFFYENCPDRVTGRKSLSELQSVCPGRKWRFVTINIPYSETVAHRQTVIDLIHPHNTEMDLSIAYALYFASRGTGVTSHDPNISPSAYTTPARVLLSGLGADELFGGYTRHLTAFKRLGFPGLLHEMKLDIDRLGKRNLGRDDRVTSHWGREARFPFLDEALVKWAVETPITQKCGFGSPPSKETSDPELEPGKKILRLLAYKLGMKSLSMEKKRAIQFGARTAKMQDGGIKGTARVE
ncbi:Asparagine synthetase domain-containing protein [Podosphaera aphanis]|nr:Asparagine synthetase domain-containing protein [Podosphaera aphanis]